MKNRHPEQLRIASVTILIGLLPHRTRGKIASELKHLTTLAVIKTTRVQLY